MIKVCDIIKYEGDNSTFIWKHPAEDFNCLSQLIVHESQEAIFFMNGQVMDVFGPGRYRLETENLPIIGKIIKKFTGDISPFHCEVYFVNKSIRMSMKWGTDSKVEFLDPQYKFPLAVGASGEMILKVDDSSKLIMKLVGTETYLGKENIISFFRAFLMTKVKTYIAQIIKTKAIGIFEIDAQLSEFSMDLFQLLIPDFYEYGVCLERFFVTNVVKPEDDPVYQKYKELYFRQYADVTEAKIKQQTDIINAQTEAQKIIIESQAIATKREQEGYTYAQERGFDVAEKVAENNTVGQYTSMGIGIGTMAGVGGALGGLVGNAINSSIREMNNDDHLNKKNDHSELKSHENELDEFKNKVNKLKAMKDAGLISDDEYKKMKNELISQIM